MSYTCPVCGYDKLEEPPSDWTICACCRTMFDYSDSGRQNEELRAAWISDGAPWRGQYIPAPEGWNPVAQLRNIGYAVTAEDCQHLTPQRRPRRTATPAGRR